MFFLGVGGLVPFFSGVGTHVGKGKVQRKHSQIYIYIYVHIYIYIYAKSLCVKKPTPHEGPFCVFEELVPVVAVVSGFWGVGGLVPIF